MSGDDRFVPADVETIRDAAAILGRLGHKLDNPDLRDLSDRLDTVAEKTRKAANE